jgi:hypothetical protein
MLPRKPDPRSTIAGNGIHNAKDARSHGLPAGRNNAVVPPVVWTVSVTEVDLSGYNVPDEGEQLQLIP